MMIEFSEWREILNIYNVKYVFLNKVEVGVYVNVNIF